MLLSPVVIDPVDRVAGRVVIAHPWDRGARCRRCGPRRSRAARYRGWSRSHPEVSRSGRV